VVGGGDHEAKADYHIEVANEVMEWHDIAEHTQGRVNAVVNLTRDDGDARHCDPAKQEDVQPHVENEREVEACVLATDARVCPEGVGFISIDAFVAHVAVLRARWSNNLALEAEILGRNLLHDVLPVELGVSLHVAGVLARHHAEGNGKFRHAQRGRNHKVVDVEHGFNHNDVVEPNENEKH